MSRGLGSMQRDILHIYDASLVTPLPYQRHWGDWRQYGWLQTEVARMQGLWCETDCWSYPDLPRPPHFEHIAYAERGAFTAAFARAMRTLIRRGVLVGETLDRQPYRGWRNQRIETVARVKC